jgi:hypothetical protein
MPDDAATIQAIRGQALQLIADITATPKPTYFVDGQSVSWESYLARLQQTVDWCDAQLRNGEPFEFHTRGGTR